MFIKKLSLPRRTFLRGMGATLALAAAGRDGSGALRAGHGPRRHRPPGLGFVFVPNGLILKRVPAGDRRKIEGFDLPRILAPLAPYQ